ncbi:MAG: membrane protein insertase YidC [Spirochaetales bacterium]|nr:membrane protein insertase YidC [Spirochaetales bacterium]
MTKEERRRMVLAVVLSTVIISVGFMVQNALFPPAEQTPSTQTVGQNQNQQPAGQSAAQGAGSQVSALPAGSRAAEVLGMPAPKAKELYTIETDVLTATLTNEGGEIVSLKLKKHKDSYGDVDLIVPGEQGAQGLSLSIGTETQPVRALMNARWLDEQKKTIEFSGVFEARVNGSTETVPFVLKKAYSFRDTEYMFGLAVTIEQPDGKPLMLGSNGVAYRLDMGPQIGPRFDLLPKNADYRKYIAEINNKKKVEQVRPNTPTTIENTASWLAIAGKYFVFIAVPEAPLASYQVLQGQDPVINQTNQLALLRAPLQGSAQTDTYYFYFGPKTSSELGRYEYADKNSFGKANLRLEDAMERSGALGWLENILKFFLNLFYRLIPNYGIAIILVTVLIKAIFFPLTRQSSLATARMAEIQPKIAELQAKYKSNPQKLNQEMAELYKREGYNPMSGCLPLLIQFPLFIAMYNLFNNHFDLRGAMFIPGWIQDLSLPESIINFGDFRIPLLGWNDLRALPIIYLVSQLFYGKFTQAPQSAQANSQQASQMKFMMYGMPIMFFFILYDVPAGLLIYWITNNVLTIAQQVVINRMMKQHKIAGPVPIDDLMNGRNGKSQAGSKIAPAARKGTSKTGPGFSERITKWLEEKAGAQEKGGSKLESRKDSGKSGKKN